MPTTFHLALLHVPPAYSLLMLCPPRCLLCFHSVPACHAVPACYAVHVLLCRHDVVEGDYSDLLSSSIFCLVLPGDGWSARMDDAMLHGWVTRLGHV
jgi:hypothetical protein